VPVIERMQKSGTKTVLRPPLREVRDFRRAYEPDGMRVEEFDSYGATVRTLRAFTASWHDLVNLMRDFMLPDPDVK